MVQTTLSKFAKTKSPKKAGAKKTISKKDGKKAAKKVKKVKKVVDLPLCTDKPFTKTLSRPQAVIAGEVGPRVPIYKHVPFKPAKESDVTFPLVGFGTYGFKKEEVLSPVKDALAKGYRLIDTAQIYENEKFVGQAIAASKIPREELFITTKVWRSQHGYDRCKTSILKSLRQMKLDYLDCVLIHYPGCKSGWPLKKGTTSPPNWKPSMRHETWRALEDLQADGKIRVIGVSNYSQRHLEELMNHKGVRVTPQVLQVECHPKQAQYVFFLCSIELHRHVF